MTHYPPVISLDIETYGAFERSASGVLFPRQNHFHPVRCLRQDQIPLEHLTPMVTLTLVETDPRMDGEWNADAISALRPAHSMVLLTHLKDHRRLIRLWLKHADTLIGMNLQFDLLMLRADPEFRRSLGGRHTILDLSVINHLQDENRVERSLKNLGPVLGTHIYKDKETLKNGQRFPSSLHPKAQKYGCSDTHNTILAVSRLAEIMVDSGEGHRLDPYTIQFYSKTIWTCVRMSESGLPLSSPRLEALKRNAELKCDIARRVCAHHDLKMDGVGSQLSKDAFVERCLSEAPQAQKHPMLEITKTGKISFSSTNRQIILSELPQGSGARVALRAAGLFLESQKLLSTYLWPLLYHKRNKPEITTSKALPWKTPNASMRTSTSWSRLPSRTSPVQPNSSPSRCGPTSFPSRSTRSSRTTRTTSKPACKSRTGPVVSSPGSPAVPIRQPGSDPRFVPSLTRTSECADLVAYPSWFPTPSPFKDGAGSEGGTKQSRITCKLPARQTFPPLLQKCEISRHDGGSILAADIKQAELRVPGLLCGDPSYLRWFREDVDPHQDQAIRLFGPEVLEDPRFKSFHRQVGKMIVFANQFRASARRMQFQVYQMTGQLMPLAFFKDVVRRRQTDYPGLWAWQESLIAEVRRTSRVEVPLTGHARHFTGDPYAHLNEIVNCPVQIVAANVTLAIQHELNRKLPDPYYPGQKIHMFTQVYDAVYLDVPAGQEGVAEAMFYEAAAFVTSLSGYWGRLQAHFNREVPLEFDVEFKDLGAQ